MFAGTGGEAEGTSPRLAQSLEEALEGFPALLNDPELLTAAADVARYTAATCAMIPEPQRQMIALFAADTPFFILVDQALNDLLRDEMKPPMVAALWMLMHALKQLRPVPEKKVYRGCKLALADLGSGYSEGSVVTWCGFSTVATTVAAVRDHVGKHGPRTLFHITLNEAVGRDLSPFAPLGSGGGGDSGSRGVPVRPLALVLPPNMRLRIDRVTVFQEGLSVVQCTQLATEDVILDLAFIDPYEKAIADLKPDWQVGHAAARHATRCHDCRVDHAGRASRCHNCRVCVVVPES
jgi:hypothetical protein